jgi:ParB family chromosome partitioning protein
MKRGLGTGFESLIPTDLVEEEFDPTYGEDERLSNLSELSIEKIFPDPEQPRRNFTAESLNTLSDSIKKHGILQPIVVVRDGNNYKIVAGERRYRAAKLANLSKIPAIIRTLDDQNRLELSIIENVQREDLNAIEIATAFAKLKAQFNLSAAEVAEKVGKSESSVINTMRLLNLPEKAKRVMVERNLNEGVMRPLITADPATIDAVLPKIINENWSARKVEEFVSRARKARKRQEPNLAHHQLEESSLSHKLGGLSVRIKGRDNGEVVIKFKNKEELSRICSI